MRNIEELDQPEEMKAAFKDMIQSKKGFILLTGKNGTGKTYASLEVYRHFTRYKLPAFSNEMAMFLNQATLSDVCAKERALYGHCLGVKQDLKNTNFLIIDDLGQRAPTDSVSEVLFDVIDHRWMNKKPTIITTNLNSKDMRDKFGDAFVSRAASGKIFRLEGEDRRFKFNF